MPVEMLFNHCFSTLGRSSAKTLDGMRRQLCVGCDPAFDYEADARLRADSRREKERDKKDVADENSADVASSSLEHLRKALREVQGTTLGSPGDDGNEKEPEETPLSPQDARRLREQNRKTSAFKAVSRADIEKLDVVNRFRAPPPGVYDPKEDLLSTRRRILDVNFGYREPTRSIKAIDADGSPKSSVAGTTCHSIDLLEGIPENNLTRKKLMDYDMQKLSPRPPLSTACTYENSFTAGVLDGDKVRIRRQPEWDFAKTSTSSDKPREYYFQPGQYKCDLDVVRPRLCAANISFDRQQNRKPLIVKRASDHLPDRSLSRSCPHLSNRLDVKVPNLDHYTKRPPLINPNCTEWHDTKNPLIDTQVLQHKMTFDVNEAMSPVFKKFKSTERFHLSLQRQQEVKKMRSYGTDVTAAMRKEYLTNGPMSVETMEDWEIDKRPSVSHVQRVTVDDFSYMGGRETERRHILSPARCRDLSRAANFERGNREGDKRPKCDVHFSDTAAGIKALRHERRFEEVPFVDD